jgi:hypothetical protein
VSASSTVVTKASIGAAGLGYLLLVPDALWWKCPVHLTTGWLCPGCGGQRWLFAILQGDFAAAWQANQFLFAAPALIAIGFLLQRARIANRWKVSYLTCIAVLTLAFTVYRNA